MDTTQRTSFDEVLEPLLNDNYFILLLSYCKFYNTNNTKFKSISITFTKTLLHEN